MQYCSVFLGERLYKSSAVAEMGDRGHNRHGPKREGGLLCPFRGGAGSPSNTMWPGPRPTSVPSGVFMHPNMGQKLGGGGGALCSGGSWVPVEHKVAWAEANLHTKCHLDPSRRLTTIKIGRKLGVCPLFGEGSWVPIEYIVAWAKAYLHTKWHLSLFNHLATTDNGRKLEAVPL